MTRTPGTLIAPLVFKERVDWPVQSMTTYVKMHRKKLLLRLWGKRIIAQSSIGLNGVYVVSQTQGMLRGYKFIAFKP